VSGGLYGALVEAADHLTDDQLAERIASIGGPVGDVLLAVLRRANGETPVVEAKGVPDPDEAAEAEAAQAATIADLQRQLAEVQAKQATAPG
jgi:hypothetical protein